MSLFSKIIVGLGNPTPRYGNTRHNAGIWALLTLSDRLGCRLLFEKRFGGCLGQAQLSGESVALFHVEGGYMNESGGPIGNVLRYFRCPPETLVLFHDELDLPVGRTQFKYGGGHAGHNGVRDTISVLGTPLFWRLRIGIGKPLVGSVTQFVLNPPDPQESVQIQQGIEGAMQALLQGAVLKNHDFF